jgi:hypothetical protein
MITSSSDSDIANFIAYLRTVYPEINTRTGKVLDYVGMTFDFTVDGKVGITMENAIGDIIASSGIKQSRTTPATDMLFTVRESPRLSVADSKYFHTHVAKMLYVAKRVKPECLAAVSFLASRVQVSTVDDMEKLQRLLGYLLHTRHRGIVLCIGDNMEVRAYIDAAYGVHTDCGKSHTGCALVLGCGGLVYAKSGKQKIVTKSSTEAELVALSDMASQAINLRNFIISQGYDVGPAILYQDNMSTMALMKRGGPGSERSRHINIRHFWVSERVDDATVRIEYMPTEEMYANILTKPVQGAQFEKERFGLTNWV